MDEQRKGSRHSYTSRHSPTENYNACHQEGDQNNQEKNNADVLTLGKYNWNIRILLNAIC